MTGAIEQTDDLREFYITPDYLHQMKSRARMWSNEALQIQIKLFKKTIPDYPEVAELLEGELHRRNLNLLLKRIRSDQNINLKSLLAKYKKIPDFAEMIQTEIEIRSGVRQLNDLSQEQATLIQAS